MNDTRPLVLVVEDNPEMREYIGSCLAADFRVLTAADGEQGLELAQRLKPEAPLILACNHHAYASQPLLLAAWGERWRMQGATPDEIQAKLGKILQGADPPRSEEAVAEPPGAGFFAAKGLLGAALESVRIPWSVEPATPRRLQTRAAVLALVEPTGSGWSVDHEIERPLVGPLDSLPWHSAAHP